jgi:hypothetical protein
MTIVIFYVVYLFLLAFSSMRLIFKSLYESPNEIKMKYLYNYYTTLYPFRGWIAVNHLLFALVFSLLSLQFTTSKHLLITMFFELTTYLLSIIVASNGLHEDLSSGQFQLKLGSWTQRVHEELIKFSRRSAKICANHAKLVLNITLATHIINILLLILSKS